MPREAIEVSRRTKDKVIELVETSGHGAPWIATKLNEDRVECPYGERGWQHYHVRQVYRDATGKEWPRFTGTGGRPRKTTIYLPAGLKERIERIAAEQRRSEAEVIRSALGEYTMRERPRPTLPLVRGPVDTTDDASRVDELLREDFGEQ